MATANKTVRITTLYLVQKHINQQANKIIKIKKRNLSLTKHHLVAMTTLNFGHTIDGKCLKVVSGYGKYPWLLNSREATGKDRAAWQCQLQTQVCHEEPCVYLQTERPLPSNRGKSSPSRQDSDPGVTSRRGRSSRWHAKCPCNRA